MLPKFSDFINPDDCIGIMTSKSIRLQPVFIFKKNVSYYKKNIMKKIRNSGNCIYDYAHSFLGENF